MMEALGADGAMLVVEGYAPDPSRLREEVGAVLRRHGGRHAEPGSTKWAFGSVGTVRLPLSDAPLVFQAAVRVCWGGGGEASYWRTLTPWLPPRRAQGDMLQTKPSLRVVADMDDNMTHILCPQWSHEQMLRLKDRLKIAKLHPHFLQITYKPHVRTHHAHMRVATGHTRARCAQDDAIVLLHGVQAENFCECAIVELWLRASRCERHAAHLLGELHAVPGVRAIFHNAE